MAQMQPALRKFALTAHVASSVGWLGAVAAFLVLAVYGATSRDTEGVRSAYFAMALTGWLAIVPFCAASVLTGLASSLGSPWGLFRHYWVVAKLALTVPASVLLLVHMRPIDFMAAASANAAPLGAAYGALRAQLVFEAAAAVLVLLVATALSVYKPRGLTRFGWRRLHEGI